MPLRTLARGEIYEGTAGIALFIAELYRHTAQKKFRETAEGALRFALRDAEQRPAGNIGFMTGRVGIAYAALRVGLMLQQDFSASARAILKPLAGRERLDVGLDVINGAAGAIPALLWMSDLGDSALAAVAGRLGDHLVAIARKEPVGWSWGRTMPVVRNLCGYSHGAAGMAHAFLELYNRTGDGTYRYAAEQAFLYEDRWLEPQEGNWPDLRHKELCDYVFEGRLEELRARLQEGVHLRPARPSFMTAWCHGAPGIALSRLRAVQVLGHPRYLADARIAIGTTVAALTDDSGYSLCHGKAGNCETLMVAATVLREPHLWNEAAQCAQRGVELYERPGKHWPCGTRGGVPDPGLLLGEAGIGFFLLRLARPQTDSVLFLTPAGPEAPHGPEPDPRYAAARQMAVDDYFGRTLKLLDACRVNPGAFLPPDDDLISKGQSPVEVAYTRISSCIAREKSPARRKLLMDAFMPEKTRYELLSSIKDYTEEMIETLARIPIENIDWERTRFARSPRARLFERAYEWDGWPYDDSGKQPPKSRTCYLMLLSAGNTSLHRLAPLPALLLRRLARPATLEGLTSAAAAALGGLRPAQRARLRKRVRQDLTRAYEMGIVNAMSRSRLREPAPARQSSPAR